MQFASEIEFWSIDGRSSESEYLCRSLKAAGLPIQETDSWEDKLQDSCVLPHLVILDTKRINQKILEVCQRIKRQPSAARITLLVLSHVRASEQQRVRMMENGIDACLCGHTSPDKLAEAIQKLFRHHEAEKEPELTAQQWRATVDAIHDELCLLDANGRILCYNHAVSDRLQKPYREVVNKPCVGLLCPRNSCTLQCPALRIRKTRQREMMDLPMGGRWYEVTAEPLLSETGDLDGLVLVRSDITGRRRAREELRESEQRYRLLFESNPYPMWTYDLKTLSFLTVNEAAVRQYEYSQGEFSSMKILDLYAPNEISAEIESRLRSRPCSDAPECCRHVKKDGSPIYVETRRHDILFGDRPGCLVLANDVTQEKRSESLYRVLVDTIPSSVLLLDKSLRVVLVNRNFLEKAHRSEDETVGKHLTAVFPEVILKQIDLQTQIRQVFRDNQPTEGRRLTYRSPGIPTRTYYYRIIPVGWGAAVEYAMLIMEDITEQIRFSEEIQRVERHLASVVESASDMVVSTDTEGRILSWNQAAQQASGFTFEEVRGHFLYRHCPEGLQGKIQSLFSEMGTFEKGPTMAEWELVTKQGERRPISWVFSTLKDDVGGDAGIVAVGRDLTERRKFEAQLLQSQKLAALGMMAGGIAHEIRSPLAISSSAAQFLMEEDLAPQFQKECAKRVHLGIQRASVIIENLLRFARPSARSEMTSVDLCSTLHRTLNLVSNEASIQKVEIKSDLPRRNLVIRGIPSLLEQVFMNIFLNALRAMPEGGCLDVSVQASDNECRVRIADNGCGIDPEDIDKIFDPFFTKASVGKGTGLGLSICYSIVQHHQGSIEVESKLGKGTVVSVRLPLLPPDNTS
jgi:PAS domain S-box-containing protein